MSAFNIMSTNEIIILAYDTVLLYVAIIMFYAAIY